MFGFRLLLPERRPATPQAARLGRSGGSSKRRRFVVLTSAFLFAAEGEHGVDGGSSARGLAAGNESNSEKKQACRHDGGQIGWCEAKEHAGDEAARREA
jgi:hypothetical protein